MYSPYDSHRNGYTFYLDFCQSLMLSFGFIFLKLAYLYFSVKYTFKLVVVHTFFIYQSFIIFGYFGENGIYILL